MRYDVYFFIVTLFIYLNSLISSVSIRSFLKQISVPYSMVPCNIYVNMHLENEIFLVCPIKNELLSFGRTRTGATIGPIVIPLVTSIFLRSNLVNFITLVYFNQNLIEEMYFILFIRLAME